MSSELSRVLFVQERDGPEAATLFAKRTLSTYWSALKRKPGPKLGAQFFQRSGYGNGYRIQLIQSCIELRNIISERK